MKINFKGEKWIPKDGETFYYRNPDSIGNFSGPYTLIHNPLGREDHIYVLDDHNTVRDFCESNIFENFEFSKAEETTVSEIEVDSIFMYEGDYYLRTKDEFNIIREDSKLRIPCLRLSDSVLERFRPDVEVVVIANKD